MGENTYYIQRNKYKKIQQTTYWKQCKSEDIRKIYLKVLKEKWLIMPIIEQRNLEWPYQYMQSRFQTKDSHIIISKNLMY